MEYREKVEEIIKTCIGVNINASVDLSQIDYPVFHVAISVIDSRVIELGIFHCLEC